MRDMHGRHFSCSLWFVHASSLRRSMLTKWMTGHLGRWVRMAEDVHSCICQEWQLSYLRLELERLWWAGRAVHGVWLLRCCMGKLLLNYVGSRADVYSKPLSTGYVDSQLFFFCHDLLVHRVHSSPPPPLTSLLDLCRSTSRHKLTSYPVSYTHLTLPTKRIV